MYNTGDIVINHESVSSGAYMDIKPTGGEVWALNAVYAPDGSAIELYRTDGTNEFQTEPEESTGGFRHMKLYADASVYFRVKNVSGGTIYMGFDAVRVK